MNKRIENEYNKLFDIKIKLNHISIEDELWNFIDQLMRFNSVLMTELIILKDIVKEK